MARYAWACFAAAIREQRAERDSQKAACECESQHKTCRLAQRRSECAGKLKQWNQQQEANWQMHGEWMKSSQELLPVCVRIAIEFEQPRQQNEKRAERNSHAPLNTCEFAIRQKSSGKCRHLLTNVHASRPFTTLAGTGPVSF